MNIFFCCLRKNYYLCDVKKNVYFVNNHLKNEKKK